LHCPASLPAALPGSCARQFILQDIAILSLVYKLKREGG
jgi:hypothetical protein